MIPGGPRTSTLRVQWRHTANDSIGHVSQDAVILGDWPVALAQIFANVLDEVRDERNKGRDSDRPYDNDGVWFYLKAGLETAGGAHFVHEWLPGDALSDLKTVREGRCEECRSEEHDDG